LRQSRKKRKCASLNYVAIGPHRKDGCAQARDFIKKTRPKCQVPQSDEEFLKWGQERFQDVGSQIADTETNFHALYGSLIERYSRHDLSIHMHLSIDDGKRSELCIAVEQGGGAGANVMPELAVLDDKIFTLGMSSHKIREKYPSVFINVCKFIQNPEHRFVEVLPQVIRLETFDVCNRIYGNPVKTVPPNLLFEQFSSTTDGEHIFFSGLTVRSKYKFPYQIVKGGTEILESISDNQSKASGHRPFRDEEENSLILGSVRLSHHFAWIALKVPLKFGFQRLNVLCSPEDFKLDGIKGSHNAP